MRHGDHACKEGDGLSSRRRGGHCNTTTRQHIILGSDNTLEAPAARCKAQSKRDPHLPSLTGEYHVDLQAVQSGSWYRDGSGAGSQGGLQYGRWSPVRAK